MGIRGIFGEIGPGERVALSKLAVEHYEKTNRAFRIAVDISIWNFQIQSGKGGSNPALRTLYYRLLRLLSLNIQPLFVFDGPHRPPFKRNVKTNTHAASLPNFMTKQLLKNFGFPFHTAPGEAEAECALLQQEGIVDAVLSEDVDTPMFGCTLSLRNWTSEGTKGNKTPTHVNVYKAEVTKTRSGLDRNGMILIALMSGGDYIPAGMPGCGIKIACEAARAGFGMDLCKLSRKDKAGLEQWRDKLAHELKTNESGFFRCKHKALSIPEDFPNIEVLGYYTHPVVTSSERVSQLSNAIIWDSPIDIPGLRIFVSEAFEWNNLSGANKFIRGLAPALLAHYLRMRGESKGTESDDLATKEQEEAKIISSILGRRSHFMTDGIPELRVAYRPADIVGLDLGNEKSDDDLMNAGSDSENTRSDGKGRGRSPSPTKRSAFDPTQIEKIWVLETYVKLGLPLTVENWEESMRNPKKRAVAKARQRAPAGGMKKGTLDSFVKVIKPGVIRTRVVETADLPLMFLAPSAAMVPEQRSAAKRIGASKARSEDKPSTPRKRTGKSNLEQRSSTVTLPFSSPLNNNINLWSLSRRPSDTLDPQLSPGKRYSALGIYGFPQREQQNNTPTYDKTSEVPTSSPPSPSPKPRKSTKHPKSSIERLVETDGKAKKSHSSSFRPPSPGEPHETHIDLSTPSPRKKRPSQQTPHDTSTPKPGKPTHPILPDITTHSPPSPPQNPNRNFSSPSSSLPSPSTLFFPHSNATTTTTTTTNTNPASRITTTHTTASPTTSNPSARSSRLSQSTLIAPRPSLPGAWKTLDAWETETLGAAARAVVYRDVEVVDMTGD